MSYLEVVPFNLTAKLKWVRSNYIVKVKLCENMIWTSYSKVCIPSVLVRGSWSRFG